MKTNNTATHWTDEYSYYDNLDFPKLVLGIPIDSAQEAKEYKKYKIKKEYKPLRIAHSTSGRLNYPFYLYCIELEPTYAVYKNMVKLCRKYYGSAINFMPHTYLDEIISYRKDLNELLEVDCNCSYHFLAEGVYPVDNQKEHLSKLTTSSMSPNAIFSQFPII